MPIYEYKAIEKGCDYCRDGFDIIQHIYDEPIAKCPKCQAPVRKLMSTFHACVFEIPDEMISAEKEIRDYESEGMWSHAAELADKTGLKERAREDYKKAGYNF